MKASALEFVECEGENENGSRVVRVCLDIGFIVCKGMFGRWDKVYLHSMSFNISFGSLEGNGME